jgi:hypothetical protein
VTAYWVTVAKNERGAWCVYLDGQLVSDHATHIAARLAAQRHCAPVPAERSNP